MIDGLRNRGIRLGVVSNCFAEDVVAWPNSSLASRFDCTVFSFEVGLAKPDPEIFREAARRLQVDVSQAWFVGDGGDEELSGAEQAGFRPFRALWFLRRWPHFQEEPGSTADVATVGDIVSIVERAIRGSLSMIRFRRRTHRTPTFLPMRRDVPISTPRAPSALRTS